jgi:amino acid adenylation domain-containing protein
MSDIVKKLANLSPEEKRAYLAKLLREKANQSKDWLSLSHGQRALWFLHRLAPESPAYNLIYAARIRSTLDIQALQRSINTLLQLYPILTTTYTMRNGVPIQRFHSQQQIPVEIIDASPWSWEQLNQQLQVEGDHPFDLEQGPILRIKLYRRTAQDYMLALTVHHIAVDFLSLDILINELSTLYSANVGVSASAGDAVYVPLSQGGPQYADYIRWQTEMLASPQGERLWTYWQQELAGELPMLNLPIDRPRPPVQTYRGASHTFQLDQELSRRLKSLATAEKATLYMLLLAAFQVLLFRYTDQEDILIGTPSLGRSRADLERIVGYLVNPVVLRSDLSGNPSFKDLLNQVRHKVIAALEHQDYPFSLLVERLQPKRDPSYSPLFQAMFILDRSPQIARGGLGLEPVILEQRGAPFDLTLRMSEADGTLSADLRYNVDLFNATTIARMENHLRALLAGIVANPEQRLRDLPLLTEAERHQLLIEWNDTQSDYPEHECIHRLIELQVQRTPDATAVLFDGEILTYKELNRRANQLALALQTSSVGPDVLVGVCMERSFEMVVALLGILKAGGAYVPLDPTYPRERLDYMLHDSKVSVLLTQTRLLDRLPYDGMEVICLDANRGASASEQAQDENPTSAVQPDNLAYMIYTSGSTGRPKGVMSVHRGLTNRLHWMQQAYQLTPSDRVMQKTPFSFDVSVWEFFWPLLTGACLVVARPGGHQDATYLVSLIAEQQITTLHFVPSMLQVFLMHPELERCKSLKHVICSGEALSYELQERFFARFPAKAELHNLYGPTEASIDVTYWQCQHESHEWIVPIGHPIANTQIYLLDQSQNPVPIGVPGELYIGGVGLARGYFNRPELSAEKFVPDPFREGERLFRTGDLARYRADGAIEFLGRIDHQVKISGFRIELGEIEVVLGQHPAIKEVVVVAREDVPGNKRLVAYLVPAPTWDDQQDTHLLIEALRNFLKEKLPHYMIPSSFVFLPALPLMPNGKVNRRELPAPEMTRPDRAETFVPPRNSIEEQLASIWASVLGIDKVGIHDNFFDLGGASIQSLQIIAKASEVGLQLTPEMLFEHQTIAEMAAIATINQPGPTSEAYGPDSSRPGVVSSLETTGGAYGPDSSRPGVGPVSSISQPDQTATGNTIIESIGVYLPPKVVTTKEVLQNCNQPINFPLEQFTGIHSRRMAGETEFAIDLAKKAVANCLANSRYKPEDIDLLICSNISRCDGPQVRVSFEPSTSVRLKHHFGFENAFVFDISNACTGMFTAVWIIDAFLKAGLIRRGMVVSGEYITHLTQTAQKEIESYMDSRLACLTVGDAGAAMILEQSPNKNVGFHEIDLYTLGRYYNYCIAKASDKEHGGAIMYTDAVRVASLNIQQAISHAVYTLERAEWSPEAFQHIIMHQTSKMSLNDAAREINRVFGREVCTQDNVIYNLAERGNTASTTHVVALLDYILSNKIKSGDNVVFGITGSGATIGTALYTFDDLPDRMRRNALRHHGNDTVGELPKKDGRSNVVGASAKLAEQRRSLGDCVSIPRPSPQRSEAERVSILRPAGKGNSPRIRVESIGTLPKGTQVKRETLELVRVAAENCLAQSSYSRSDIDLLIYAGVYRDEILCEPAIAAIIAGLVKINDSIETQQEKKTFAFDLFNGTVGFLNACQVASGMIQAKKIKRAMVVASEIENNAQAFPTELLGVSETGSAVILDESADGRTGFGNIVCKYFTDYLEAFSSYTQQRNGKTYMHFEKDPDLETYYLHCIRDAVRELLSLEQLDLAQVSVILPPQISAQFIARLSEALNISRDKFVDIAHPGNDLYTSSLPYTLQHVREQKLVQPGDVGLIITAGSGIQVGCATYYF